MMATGFIPLWIAIVVCIIIPEINMRNFIYRRKVRKRENRMPELMNEVIGKVCEISIIGTVSGSLGRIEAVEGNWLKVNEKGKIRLINADMIINIRVMPDKYQK